MKKTDALKICSQDLKKCTSLEEKKGKRYIQGNIYFGIIVFNCLSTTKPCPRFVFICFAWEINGFLQSSSGNEVDFREIMNISPNILAKNLNFKKLRQFWRTVLEIKEQLITISISSSKILLPLLLAKEKTWKHIFNTISAVNYCKIVQENKLSHPNQQ